jgi:hypothetical protein
MSIVLRRFASLLVVLAILWQAFGGVLPNVRQQEAASLEHALVHGQASDHHHDGSVVHDESEGSVYHAHFDDGLTHGIPLTEAQVRTPRPPSSVQAADPQPLQTLHLAELFRPPREA